MFVRWARVVIQRPWALLVASAAFVIAAAVWGVGVMDRLDGGGWEDPKSESARASAFLRQNLGRADADVVALYTHPNLTVDDPEYERQISDIAKQLPSEHVAAADSFYSTRSPSFVSTDRRQTFIVMQLRGEDDDARQEAFRQIKSLLSVDGFDVQLGGQVVTRMSVEERADKDLARAELLSMPLLLLLLLLVFRSLVAAVLPLLIGVFAIAGSLLVLRVVTEFTAVSAFAMNIVLLLGLGLAVDYALFMISRFREELQHGHSTKRAVGRTVCTAGRTVLFSALTVAGSVAGLLVFPQPFLRSMAMGGIAAVLMALIGALVILPAILRLLGPRIDAVSFAARRRWRRRPGAWAKVARSVMRQPAFYALVCVEVLLLMGSPFLHVQFNRPDASVLPPDEGARQVNDALNTSFNRNQTKPIAIGVTMDGAATSTENLTRLTRYSARLAALQGVARVESPSSIVGTPGASAVLPGYANGRFARVDVFFEPGAQSADAQQLVRAVRSSDPPVNATVLVGGETSKLVDLVDGRNSALLPMFGVIITVIGVLLFFAFGSIVLSLKAIVMNVLSLAASFGAVVWIFQDGHFAGLFGASASGSIDATQPVLMLAVVFGLSMDYEVFLLSRVREAYLRTHNTARAVAIGMQQTGPIITRAALLMIVVVGAFSTSDIVLLKMVGVGMAIAIAVDATIVRGLLVPATMRMMGRANWWSPKLLKRLRKRFVHEPAPLARRRRRSDISAPHRAHPKKAAPARPLHHPPRKQTQRNRTDVS